MAITTDTGAKKIENSENWRHIFGIHNDTVDAYDALAEQKDEEIGIVVKGNKTAHTGGAAAGQYIILRNSTITGCDDGLYTAAQAIPYDTAIDSTYLTPVSGGGLNALNASLKWQYIGNVTGSNEITYPEEAKEILLQYLFFTDVLITYSVCLQNLPSATRKIFNGTFDGSGVGLGCNLNPTTRKLSINDSYFNSNQGKTGTLYVYWR